MQVGQVVTLTLVVEADGPVRHPPERIDLGQISDIAERFYIETPDGDDAPPVDGRRWEFVYRLKPRRPDVAEIPGVPFAFFNPSIRPENKAFQVKYTDAIPLQVTSTGQVMQPAKPRAVADVFPADAGGPALLARRTPWTPPGPLVVAAAARGAAAGDCVAWFLVWRRLNPDAGRQKERPPQPCGPASNGPARAGRSAAAVEPPRLLTAAVVADYLHEEGGP